MFSSYSIFHTYRNIQVPGEGGCETIETNLCVGIIYSKKKILRRNFALGAESFFVSLLEFAMPERKQTNSAPRAKLRLIENGL